MVSESLARYESKDSTLNMMFTRFSKVRIKQNFVYDKIQYIDYITPYHRAILYRNIIILGVSALMSQCSFHKISLAMKTKANELGQSVVVIFMCSCVTFVLGQVNSELDKPFVTKDGARYRDILTIASAKGVAQFAKSYQRTQRGAVSEIVPNF